MRKSLVLIGVVLLLTMVMMPWVSSAAGAPASGGSETVDPKAVQVMQKMGNYMAGLQKFKVHSDRIMEVILPNDQKLHSDRSTDLFVQKPDRLRVKVTSTKRDLEFFYDGKTFTLYTPRQKYYASAPAKPTIGEMIQYAGTEYDIEFPLVDVLYHHDVLLKDVVSGAHVGMSLIQGVKCHQLAFRQKDIDWEVWIEEGDKPLVRRIAICDKTQKGEPLTVTDLSNWDVSPTFEADLFTFTPPPDVQKIKFLAAGQGGMIQGISKGGKPPKQ
jgi:hypothetical protein